MEDEEYASDTDQSDEDFCPEANAGSNVSEEESGSDEQSEDNAEKETHKNNRNKKLNKKIENTKQSARSTRATIVCKENSVNSKEHLESDENDDDKERTDALWADFLNDTNSSVKTTTNNVQKEKEVLERKSNLIKITENSPKDSKTAEPSSCHGNVKVTEILEFAGEEIKVTKEIPIDNNKSKNIYIGKSTTSKELPKFCKGPMKRTSSGGLGSILGQIGKKTKISVLEKTKLDWDGFKKNEGLTEELQTFNKGKDGYLERQDFLQRTDLRQFEIERNLRQNKRNN